MRKANGVTLNRLIVDLGPEGGSGGGQILISGTPEQVADFEGSHTARFLKPILERGY